MENCGRDCDSSHQTQRVCIVTQKIPQIILIVLAILYSILIISRWGENYIDFGDGNYIYISKRMADGKMLYRDILAPQPPMHLYLGMCAAKIGKAAGVDSPLFPFRFLSLAIHLLTLLALFRTAKKLFKSSYAALAAGVIYLIIPIGFWWTRGYQSEPLEMLFLIMSFFYFIDFKPKSMITAAVFSALAGLTNMTAAPYIFFNMLYLLIRKRKLFLYYCLPFGFVMLCVVLFFEIRTGRYLENVFFNQVGSYPKKELYPAGPIAYAISKIAQEGKDIIFWEGIYIVISLLGLMRYGKKFSAESEREYVSFYTVCALGSFIFVTKGATMEYIFSIGEPWVALLGGFFITDFLSKNLSYDKKEFFTLKDLTPLLSIIIFVVAFFLTVIIGAFNSIGTIQEKNDELNAEGVQQIKYFIEKYSKKGDEILAPPFYAVVGDRAIFEEYSEIFLWTIKYANEVSVDKKPGLGVQKVKSIAKAIREKRLPLVIIEDGQTGRITEIKEALNEHYQWAPPQTEPFPTLNTRLLIMIPKAE